MPLSRTIRTQKFAVALLASGLGLGAIGLHQARAATADTPGGPEPSLTNMQKAIVTHVDAHLAALKKQIRITKAEQPAWHGFAHVSRDNATDLAGLYAARAKKLATMNAVQNMDSYAAIAAKQADDMNALSAAFHTLYAKLTPAQRKMVDARFRAEARAMQAHHLRALKKQG